MRNARLWGSILGIIAFIILIAGLTYAWYTWKSSDTNISGTTGCFTIIYKTGQAIGGTEGKTLDLGDTYTDGLSTTVSIAIQDTCTINGNGTIYLTTSEGTSDAILKGALKYAVVSNNEVVSQGVITEKKDQAIYDNFPLTKAASEDTAPTYTIYVWLDGDLANNSYANTTYSGFIHASAVQTGLE